MAAVFWSSGRTAITIGGSLLGYLESDELTVVQFGITNRHLKSSRGGDTIIESIYTGSNAYIASVLPEFDEAVWVTITKPPGGGAEGALGIPGTLWIAGCKTFSLASMPVTSSGAAQKTVVRARYTLGPCNVGG